MPPPRWKRSINEGWIVDAQGYHIRRAGTWKMNVTSGVDWFDLAGTINFDGLEAQLPEILEALRRGQNYVRLSDGSRGLLPQEWLTRFASMAELGEADRRRRPLPLVAGLAVGRLAGRPGAGHGRCARSRDSARTFAASTASARSTNRGASAANCGIIRKTGLGWLNFLAGIPPGRLPGRRHGPGQDDPGAGPAAAAAKSAGRRRWPPRRPRSPSCRAASSSTGSKRPNASRPNSACWTTPAFSAAR